MNFTYCGKVHIYYSIHSVSFYIFNLFIDSIFAHVCSVPGPFANALKQYSEDEILIDRDSIINGAEKPKKLQEVIAMACEDLDK